MYDIALMACRRRVVVRCRDAGSAGIVAAGFSGLRASGSAGIRPELPLCTVRSEPESGYRLAAFDDEVGVPVDLEDLVYGVDKLLTLAVQRHRRDLYFVHAAAVARRGRVAVFAAPAGTGKSTLALALVNRGFTYLSDELAPLDVSQHLVWPYPRTLCLKSTPPAPVRLPATAMRLGTRLLVPLEAVSHVAREPSAVAALFFITRSAATAGRCRPLTGGAGAARLMANALNPLAHPGHGLPAAAALGRALPCFELDTSDLAAACAAVERVLARVGTSGAAA